MPTFKTHIEIEVEIHYFSDEGFPGNHLEPPEPPTWGAEQVMVNGKDITEALCFSPGKDYQEALDDLVLEHLNTLYEDRY